MHYEHGVSIGREAREPRLQHVVEARLADADRWVAPDALEPHIVGNIVGTYNDLVELMALAQAGKVTLHTKAYPLDAAPDAFADLDAGRVRGRAILVP